VLMASRKLQVGFSVITLHLQGMSLGYSSICGAPDALLAGPIVVQKLEGIFFSLGVGVPGHPVAVSLLSPWAMVLIGHTTDFFCSKESEDLGGYLFFYME